METIKNQIFQLEINPLGAEMESLFIKGINIIRKRDLEWGKKAPNLFPIIGRLVDNKYLYQGQEYPMNAHGFISKTLFDVVSKSNNKLTFGFKADAESLQIYPFDFEFYLTYEIINNELKIICEVINIGKEDMYFAVGLHPGLSYRGLTNLLGEDIVLEFDNENHQQIYFNPAFVYKTEDIKLKHISLRDLSKLLEVEDTLCFDNINCLTLTGGKEELRIETEFKYLAFWQKNPANPTFICVEPWDGLPDKAFCNQRLEEKFEIIQLASKNKYSKKITISV